MTATIDLIRKLRGRFSQTEIARRTGISQPRLSRWENGATPAGADDALRLQALVHELGLDASPESVAPDGRAQQ